MAQLNDLQLARNMLACLPEGETKAKLLTTIEDMEREQKAMEQNGDMKQAAPQANETASSSSSSSADMLNPACKANISTRTGLETLAVALHCMLLREGFVCTGADNNAGQVQGFAAPVRDVPVEKLMPDGWNQSREAISLQYRKNGAAGKVFMMKLIEVDGEAVVHMGIKGGNIATAEFSMRGIGQGGDASLGPKENGKEWADVEQMCKDIFAQFRERILHVLEPPPAPKTEAENAQIRFQGQQIQQPPPQMRYSPPQNPPGYWPRGEGDGDPLRIGAPQIPQGRRGDFAGDVFPMPGPGSGGAGGLMGPDHPMFGGGGIGDIPGGTGGLGGLGMEPRFDPYGPPMPGMPGGPGRGMIDPRGGRGGRARQPPFGGPNPDHLPPPNSFGNNNMFM